MENLIRLFKKYYLFILFLFLEIISFSFYFARNSYASAYFFSTSNSIVGSLYEKQSELKEYLSLKQINEELIKENIQLKEELKQTILPDSLTENLSKEYFSVYDTSFQYIPARVISCTLDRSNNLITLNKGNLDGISQDMGVVNSHGVVGIVVQTSDHFSIVRPIINQHGDMGISGKFKKSDTKGSVQWHTEDYREAEFIGIGREEQVSIGDSIVSSGYSSSFPEGIPIGIVSSAECEKGDGFYNISIKLAVDYKKLSSVNVIYNLLKEEQDSIQNKHP